ncbi:MAG: class I SAM-dependent methyltransferase, partial [gamma proteobacterium symbiont of Bathyaustriella thionipta]|nr:class I SAM-dependent methyltransferase [gamma proteobacterium symbiont of Bathyaustriella thionipta]
DAFVFASLGARVTLMERSPISAALLTDALQRASLDNNISEIIKRMDFVYGDARLLESDETTTLNEKPDVIYLDPMFPHRKKSALVKKEMLAFQSLIGDDNDSNELLNISRQQAKKRVVVKRPIKAPYLDNQKPSLSMNMKKHRFDIYFV